MPKIYDATKNQVSRDMHDIFPESVGYEPQLAWEMLREIKRRLEDVKPLKSEHVAYLIVAFEKITNGVRLTGNRKTRPQLIGGIVARALYLTRRVGRSTSFLSDVAIYYRVKHLTTASYRVKSKTTPGPNMTKRRAFIQVAGEVTKNGRPIGFKGIEKIYLRQKQVMGRIPAILRARNAEPTQIAPIE